MSRLSLGHPLSDALSVIMPTREETLLLRACLLSADSAREAWREWRRYTSEIPNGYIGKNMAVKNLRPLVFDTLRRHGLELDKESQTFLRSAYLKEELRSKIFLRICRDVLQSLAKENIPNIVLKGTALAETVYKNPVLRHSHDIEIWVGDRDLTKAASLLPALGFVGFEDKISQVTLVHESALPVVLHSRLFSIPYHGASAAEMWSRRLNCRIAGVPAHVLAPTDSLLHVCGHAFYSGSRRSLRWASDAWLLIDRYRDLDWDLLFDCARQSRLVLPLSVTLSYLAENLDAPVPPTFLTRLSAAAATTNTVEREFAFSATRSSPRGGLRKLFRDAQGWRGRISVLKWMVCPSPSYLRWAEAPRYPWLLPFHYVRRPVRYISRRIGSLLIESLQRVGFKIRRVFNA